MVNPHLILEFPSVVDSLYRVPSMVSSLAPKCGYNNYNIIIIKLYFTLVLKIIKISYKV